MFWPPDQLDWRSLAQAAIPVVSVIAASMIATLNEGTPSLFTLLLSWDSEGLPPHSQPSSAWRSLPNPKVKPEGWGGTGSADGDGSGGGGGDNSGAADGS